MLRFLDKNSGYLFSSRDLREMLEDRSRAIRNEIEQVDPNQLLNTSTVDLAKYFHEKYARSPAAWNGHSAPLFLRAQVDLHITVAWILCDLADRAKKYVLHGLGEEKLLIEQYKNEITENPDAHHREQMEKMIAIKSDWVGSQRNEWMVEVNLGHWAQLNTHSMAKEADCETMYKFAYKPFSQAAHSMWPHVSVYNSKHCKNPLHRHHLIPELFDAPMDVDFLYRSCKYVHRTYESFVDRFGLVLDGPMPLEWWDAYFSSDVEGSDSAESNGSNEA